MRVLVTGSLGFLGGRLAQHLLGQGHEVLLGTSRQGQANPYGGGRLVELSWDVTDKLQATCAGVDVVVNAAGMNSSECAKDPVAAISGNAMGAARLVKAALREGVGRFVQVSTIHVYLDSLKGVVSEDLCPSNLHPYAISNRAAEDAVLQAGRTGAIDGVVLRLSNGYGVPVNDNPSCWQLLVNSLCRQVVETGKGALTSNGREARNFIPLKEVCSVVEFVSDLPRDARLGASGPINVGSETSLTVLAMAKVVQSRCEAVLKFRPQIITGIRGNLKRPAKLDYRLGRLRSIGYRHTLNFAGEVDDLFTYCARVFRPVR